MEFAYRFIVLFSTACAPGRAATICSQADDELTLVPVDVVNKAEGSRRTWPPKSPATDTARAGGE